MIQIQLPLNPEDEKRGVLRKMIPAGELLPDLELLRDPKMWKSGGAGGADQYLGGPPAIRVIDGLIAKLSGKY